MKVSIAKERRAQERRVAATPDTASLPPRNNREIVEKVFATKSPQYSNLFIGAAKKQLIVTVEVPVLRDGEVLYDISFSPPLEIFQAIIDKQRPSQDWTISIFDGNGISFARVPNPQDTIGKQASPLLYAEMLRRREATLPTVSLEGTPLITTFVRSSLTDWDRGCRDRGKLAGQPVVAQPGHHQPDRRGAAADRACLCRAHGHDDRPRRSAS